MGLIELEVLRAVQTISPLRTTLNLVETARVADVRQKDHDKAINAFA
jgi:hypothetical protein